MARWHAPTLRRVLADVDGIVDKEDALGSHGSHLGGWAAAVEIKRLIVTLLDVLR